MNKRYTVPVHVKNDDGDTELLFITVSATSITGAICRAGNRAKRFRLEVAGYGDIEEIKQEGNK